jgi:hypothetical protein
MTKRVLSAVAIAALATIGLAAQKTTQTHVGGGGSPHVKSEWTIDGAHITVTYGRPSLKGRADATLMPPGKPWRTGADEATAIMSDKALKIGTLTLAANTWYSINTQPGDTWTLIIGKMENANQWGVPYNAALEVGRVPMIGKKTAAPVETLTISVDDTRAGGTLRIEWGSVSATAPFTIG